MNLTLLEIFLLASEVVGVSLIVWSLVLGLIVWVLL